MTEEYEEYLAAPDMVEVYPLDGECEVVLRRLLFARLRRDRHGKSVPYWACKERLFRVSGNVDALDITLNFDIWWAETARYVTEVPDPDQDAPELLPLDPCALNKVTVDSLCGPAQPPVPVIDDPARSAERDS